MVDNNIPHHKVSYDGRLKFYEHLKEYWDGLRNSSIEMDYDQWYRYLRGYYSRCQPYIRQEDRTDLLNKFSVVTKLLNQSMMATNNSQKLIVECRIYIMLQEIEDVLFMSTKDMLLPTKTDEDEAFDMDKFMRKSDL